MTNNSSISFTVDATCANTKARACTLKTLHSECLTPLFMPVATNGALRYQLLEQADEIGARMLLANTYHLLLRPGTEVIQAFGGLHPFMRWERGILTDSGGFQVFSLSKSLKITEEGALFTSYVDGARIDLTPEKSIEVQRILGSDIMMPLDHCVSSTSSHEIVVDSVERTYRWAKRCLAARGESPQALFGIVQGACDYDLRKRSAEQITSLPFDGFALGGLAVGEERSQREDTTEYAAALLPVQSPRYLMGVGTPLDLLEAVARGMDMFDCILPTSLAGQGVAYTRKGRVDMRRGIYKKSELPLQEGCTCITCRKYSRAYLHQMIKVGEEAGKYLIATHNLTMYQTLMTDMRAAILGGTFPFLYNNLREVLGEIDLENPSHGPKRKRGKKLGSRGAYEVIELREGVGSIRQKASGEVMHSSEIPLEESRLLYLSQLPFSSRCRASDPSPLVVWDVGLGAATNAMAALLEYEKLRGTAPLRPLHIVSFEVDFDPFSLALAHQRLFPHLWHGAPHALSAQDGAIRTWRSQEGGVVWDIYAGDFLQTHITAPKPEVLFYDPFSYKVDSPLWTRECFEMLNRYIGSKKSWFFTYSASTLVRANLLTAGFYVAQGVGTGMKKETTIALTREALVDSSHLTLLGQEFLKRWEISDAKVPVGLTGDERLQFEETVRRHPQWKNTLLQPN